MEIVVRRFLCLVVGAGVLALPVLALVAVSGLLQGGSVIDALWRLSGLAAFGVAIYLLAVCVGLLGRGARGRRLLSGLVVALGGGAVAASLLAMAGVLPEWSPILPGLGLAGLWGLWLASHLVDLDRWQRAGSGPRP